MGTTGLAFYLSNSFSSLMIATVICGLATGMSNPPSYALLSEIALIKFRGAFASIHTMNSNAGWLFAIGVGSLVSFDIFPWMLVIPCILSLFLVWFLVESPLWLLIKDRKSEAIETLVSLRGPDYEFDQEIHELETALDKEKATFLQILKSGTKPMLVLFFLVFFQTSSGTDTVSIYSLIIFSDFEINKHTFALMFQGMVTLGYLLSPLIMLKLNRKPQLVISSCTMATGMVLVGSTAFLPSQFQAIIPIIGVILSGLSYGTGVGSVPYAMMSEIFPQRMKSVGLAVALSAKSILTFVHIKAFPSLRSSVGISNIFFLHAAMLMLSVVFTLLCVPETKDKSVTQLESIFEKNKRKRNSFSRI